MGNIVLLDDLTINKIAAGEVIERPASVVKEMLENSIDAGAKNVNIEIQNGGISKIRISDNGKGIEPDDMVIAFERHATSKIRQADDLEYVRTMGFRGEALASIAAIARVEMISRTVNSETGYKVVVEAGNIISEEMTACPVGTIITVEKLFFNTPVRYKFLKKDYTESGYIEDAVKRIALINPDISIKLINNGKTIIQTNGNGKLSDVVYGIYGKDIVESLLNINYKYEDIIIKGVIGKPEIARSNRSNQMFFVNNRYVKDKTLSAAVEQAMKGMLPIGKFPFLVINIEINPKKVDVNVHPAKVEVRFVDESEIFKAVVHAIKETLLANSLISNISREYNTDYLNTTVSSYTNTSINASANTNIYSDANINTNINPYADASTNSNTNMETYLNTENDVNTDINVYANISSDSDTNVNTYLDISSNVDSNTNTNINDNMFTSINADNNEDTNTKIYANTDVNTNMDTNSSTIKNNYHNTNIIEEIFKEKERKQLNDSIDINLEKSPYNNITKNNTVNEDTCDYMHDNLYYFEKLKKLQNEDLLETQKVPIIEKGNDETKEISIEQNINLGQNIGTTETLVNDNKNLENESEVTQKFEDMYEKTFGTAPASVRKQEVKFNNLQYVESDNLSMFTKNEKYRSYTYIGTVFSTYIILEVEDELYILDQHAAHERIMYEKVKENYYSSNKDCQMLLLPDVINLTNKDLCILRENKNIFENAGFKVEEFGDKTVKLFGVPSLCVDMDTKALFLDILDEIDTVARTERQEIEEKFIATVACKSAVKANMHLETQEVIALLDVLMKLPNPFTCPHGRPTAIKMTKQDIEKKFSRR